MLSQREAEDCGRVLSAKEQVVTNASLYSGRQAVVDSNIDSSYQEPFVPGAARHTPCLSPCYHVDEERGEYIANPLVMLQQRAAEQHVGVVITSDAADQPQQQCAVPVGAALHMQLQPLPAPAFELLNQPAIRVTGSSLPTSMEARQLLGQATTHGAHGLQSMPGHQAHVQGSGLSPDRFAGTPLEAVRGPPAAPLPAQPIQSTAADPTSAAGDTAELTQLLSTLSDDEIRALVQNLKARSNGPTPEQPAMQQSAPAMAQLRQEQSHQQGASVNNPQSATDLPVAHAGSAWKKDQLNAVPGLSLPLAPIDKPVGGDRVACQAQKGSQHHSITADPPRATRHVLPQDCEHELYRQQQQSAAQDSRPSWQEPRRQQAAQLSPTHPEMQQQQRYSLHADVPALRPGGSRTNGSPQAGIPPAHLPTKLQDPSSDILQLFQSLMGGNAPGNHAQHHTSRVHHQAKLGNSAPKAAMPNILLRGVARDRDRLSAGPLIPGASEGGARGSSMGTAKSNLHALLAALEQHEQSESLGARQEESADVNDSYSQGMVAARTTPRAGLRNDSIATDKDAEHTEYDDDEDGDDGSPKPKRHRDVQHLPAAHMPKRRRTAAAAAAAVPQDTLNALTGQRRLLQQREDGRRPIKPNDAFRSLTGHRPPHAQQQKRPVRHISGLETTAKPLRNPSLDAAPWAALPVKVVDGPNLPRRKLLRPRTSWGWYMLGKGRLQHLTQGAELPMGTQGPSEVRQQRGSWGEPGAAPFADAAGAADAPQGVLPQSDSSAASLKSQEEAAGTGSVDGEEATAAVAPGPMAFATLSEAAVAAAAAAAMPCSSSSSGKSGGDDTQSAAPATGAAAADVKKHRWVAGNSQWVTSDGVTVWPKDNIISTEQRVHYVAFKWVQCHWPNRIGRGSEIAILPVNFWLDQQPTRLQLTVKIRLYAKAAHLVISPYSSLSTQYAGTWMAGYGFDPKNKAVRVYLSTTQPPPAVSPGNRYCRKGKPAAKLPGTSAVYLAPLSLPSVAAARWISAAQPAPLPGSTTLAVLNTSAALACMPTRGPSGNAGPGLSSAQNRITNSSLQQSTAAAAAAAGQGAPPPQAAPGMSAHINRLGAVLVPRTTQPGGVDLQQPAQGGRGRLSGPAAAAAGVSAAPVAAGGQPLMSLHQQQQDEAAMKALQRSANSRAAVIRRWANYRAAKANENRLRAAERQACQCMTAAGGTGVDGAAAVQQKPALRLTTLGGEHLEADLHCLNQSLLSVSDYMQLPESLLSAVPGQIVQALQSTTITADTAAAATEEKEQGRRVVGGNVTSAALHAAVKAWYLQLQRAVLERNGFAVVLLVEELCNKVLRTAG